MARLSGAEAVLRGGRGQVATSRISAFSKAVVNDAVNVCLIPRTFADLISTSTRSHDEKPLFRQESDAFALL
jgi:hypothetical protein